MYYLRVVIKWIKYKITNAEKKEKTKKCKEYRNIDQKEGSKNGRAEQDR